MKSIRALTALAVCISALVPGCTDSNPCAPASRGYPPFPITEQVFDASEDGGQVLLLSGDLAGRMPGYYLARVPSDSAPELVVNIIDGLPAVDPANPVLSPDGRKVAYWRLTTGEVHVLDIETGRETQVTSAGITNARFPAWSPDGHRIAYSRVFDYGTGTVGLRIVDIDTGEEHPVSHDSVNVTCAGDLKWSPDGKWIAYSCYATSSTDLVSTDGKELLHISPDIDGVEWRPVGWIDAGPTIIFQGTWKYRPPHPATCLSYEYDVSQRKSEVLSTNLVLWEYMPIAVSRDGRYLFYMDVGPAGVGIVYRGSFSDPYHARVPVVAHQIS